MDKIYIFGHKNPDTDSVCASIALSYLKNQLGFKTEPRIISPNVNKETEYVLKRFNTPIPVYLNDVKVQIKDINFNREYVVNENTSIMDVFHIINNNLITGLPLVNDNKELNGYVSLKEIASDMILNENLQVDTSFDNLIKTLDATDYVKFDDHIHGFAHAATFDDKTFINELQIDNQSIIIVGDRDNIIKHAIEKNVKMIILIKNREMPSNLLEECKKKHINIIRTSKSSFKVARVLCLANPIKSIKRGGDIIYFNANDYLTTFNDETKKYKHTNYPIVNNRNICLGMLRTIDVHEINRKKVILVDHNTVSQSVDGLYESEILEIIDHHNIGDINTAIPINFRNMRVGSSCTIVYHLFRENNIKITRNIAGIMLSGLISDTLLLKSPTTTEIDREVAKDLARIACVKLEQYGLEMLSSGVSIEGVDAHDIIYKDFKTYTVNDYKMAIGQVFTTDIEVFKKREEEILTELNRIQQAYDYKFAALYVTNFLNNKSYVLYADNSKEILESAYGLDNASEWVELDNVVSRKQQIVPNIFSVLDHI